MGGGKLLFYSTEDESLGSLLLALGILVRGIAAVARSLNACECRLTACILSIVCSELRSLEFELILKTFVRFRKNCVVLRLPHKGNANVTRAMAFNLCIPIAA